MPGASSTSVRPCSANAVSIPSALALLTIHGGPFSQYGTGFFDEVQVYSGAGYAVLFSNPRGGSGYSEAWGRAIRWPDCAVDVESPE